MLTPQFECQQDSTHVIVHIRVPYIKLSEVDYTINENVFRFYSKPYFLRLTFSAELSSNKEQTSFNYDCEKHVMAVKMGKKNKGEFFKDLNMLTKLLSKKKPIENETSPTPLIEVLTSEFRDMKISENETFEWEQKVEENSFPGTIKYGFNGQYSEVFKSDDLQVLDLPDAENVSVGERSAIRQRNEVKDFKPDHYMYDILNTKEVSARVHFKPHYMKPVTNFKWTQNEVFLLKNLPKKEFLITTNKRVWIGLCDLLAAYAYNHRVNLGNDEENTESFWNLSKLSCSLAYLEEFTSLDFFCVSFIRRVLCYPLFRNFRLAMCCLSDVCTILQSKENIVRCLLVMNQVLKKSEKFQLSVVFVQDYCIWSQGINVKHAQSVAGMLNESMKRVDLRKHFTDLCLVQIEEFIEDEKRNGK